MSARKLLFLLFLPVLLAWPGESRAQLTGRARIDSLKAALPGHRRAGQDSAAVMALRKLTSAFLDVAPDSSIHYGLQAMALSQKAGLRYSAYRSKLFVGRAYLSKGDFPASLRYFLEALEMADRYSGAEKITVVSNVGAVYLMMGQPARALPYYRQYLDYALRVQDSTDLAAAYICVANALGELGKADSSVHYLEQGVRMFRLLRNEPAYYSALHDLGTRYQEAGDYTRARSSFFQAAGYAQQAGDVDLKTSALVNLGSAYLTQANGLAASRAGLEGATAREGRTDDSLSRRRYLLGQSVRYSALAARESRQAGMVQVAASALANLSAAQKLLGDYQGALESREQAQALKDSMFSEESRSQIEALTRRREEDVKQKQIEVQQLQIQKAHQRQWFLGAGLVLSLAIVGLVVRSRRTIARERKRSDSLLLNILPAQTARELKDHGRSQARFHEEASVLFADFKSFSLTASQLPAQALVDALDFYFRAFDRIMAQEGLEKIKTIGDAYMAVAGVPDPVPDHALRLVRAGLAMLEFVARHRQQRTDQGLPWFELRIGIHSGPLVSGVVGEKKFAFDVWGDTVNLAARLEQYGEPGRLNISRATCLLVQDHFPCLARGPVTIKHDQQVEMFFVEDIMMDPEPAPAKV